MQQRTLLAGSVGIAAAVLLTLSSNAGGGRTEGPRPPWLSDDGKTDLSKMPPLMVIDGPNGAILCDSSGNILKMDVNQLKKETVAREIGRKTETETYVDEEGREKQEVTRVVIEADFTPAYELPSVLAQTARVIERDEYQRLVDEGSLVKGTCRGS